MIYLGNGIYSDSGPDTLAHYGVLGMKWGIRKDKEFRRDLNWHEANKRIRKIKRDRNAGKYRNVPKAGIKQMIRDIENQTKAKNKAMKYDYANYKPKKGAKAKEIYEENMKRAQSEIPHYKTKHAIRKAAKIAGLAGAGYLGGFGAGALGAGALGALTAQEAAQLAATYGTSAALYGSLGYNIPKRIVRGKL